MDDDARHVSGDRRRRAQPERDDSPESRPAPFCLVFGQRDRGSEHHAVHAERERDGQVLGLVTHARHVVLMAIALIRRHGGDDGNAGPGDEFARRDERPNRQEKLGHDPS